MQAIQTDLSERMRTLRQRILRKPAVCTERGYLITQSYKETEGHPMPIRKAKALEKILSEMTINIADGEILVGNSTSKVRGAPILPELNAGWLLDEMDDISTRDWDRFEPLNDDEKAKIREFIPYWKGQSLYERWAAAVPPRVSDMLFKGLSLGSVFCFNMHYLTHSAVDYEKVLKVGFRGIKAEAEAALEKLDTNQLEDYKKYPYLKAMVSALDSAIAFSNRYAELAKSMAAKEQDPQRKAELEMIAETCARVPAEPARNFYEAMQAICMTWIILTIEGIGYGISFGRADQYLYPFYKKDIAEGRLTEDEARGLIGLLYVKINQVVDLTDKIAATVFGGFCQTVNVILGGVNAAGKDVTNDLSYVFLDAEREVGLSHNDTVVRIHAGTPDAFVLKSIEVAKALKGKLKFQSDETSIQQMLHDGFPIEHARNYIICGCNSPSSPGYSLDTPGGMANVPLLLDLALNDGKSRLTGEQLGPKTGDPRNFKSYEDVWAAFKKQCDEMLPIICLFRNADRMLFGEYAPTPYMSALFNGPIQSGRDVSNGGLRWSRLAISLTGAPNVADSLAAMKKVVFEDKKITMDQLMNALDKNFEGEEEILKLLSAAPKYGNDIDYVDTIMNDVLQHGSKVITSYPGACDTKFNVAAAAVTSNVPLGWYVGAQPDGRKKGQPLAEGGISPYQGRNVSGPVATFNSVTKVDNIHLTNGAVLNMKFSPAALKDVTSLRKLASMVRTFLETGGFFVQFNIVDTATLRAAQREPEKYKDLLVRVATYSAYFVELSPALQEDVISRMGFEEL